MDDPTALLTASARSFTVAIVFTDIAESTRLKGSGGWGAERYATVAGCHDGVFRSIVSAYAGADILKDVGDGFMAVFSSSSDAVRAALRFQRTLAADDRFVMREGERLRVRIGVHLGEVSDLGRDINNKPKLVGPAADIAARLQGLARPGQILVSRAVFADGRLYVREHPPTNPPGPVPALHWDSHGYYRFKGVEEPLEVFEVGAEGVAPRAAPPDSEKAWYVGSPDDEIMRGWRPSAGQEVPGRPRWILEDRLGEGGFGEAWLARHTSTREPRVFKFCFDANRLRSFRREITLFRLLREALGERSDIARLHEFQLERPPFYLESEYSPLGDLLGWSAKLPAGLSGVPLGERVELVARIAEAVAAAHSVGVLHKDLKPSNILMYRDERGEIRPRLADFGIGILTDPGQLAGMAITASGFTVPQLTDNSSSRTGTRLYAPPEMSAGGAFTVQGDIYALGVMLYQLVVGDLSRPLGTGWEADIDDPLVRQGVALATMRDPSRRLASASQLAQWARGLDAARAAHQREAQTAARDAARRRLVRLMGASAAALGVLAGVAGVGFWRESAARLRAERETRRAESILAFITDSILAAAPAHQGPSVTIQQTLDQGALRIDTVQDPGDRVRLHAVYGTIYRAINKYESAAHHLRLAADGLSLESPVDAPRLTETLGLLAEVQESLAKYTEGTQTRQRLEAIVGVAKDAPSLDHRMAMHLSAFQAHNRGAYLAAESDYRRALAEAGAATSVPSGWIADLARVLVDHGLLTEAQGVVSRAVSTAETEDARKTSLPYALLTRGYWREASGDPAGAVADYREAVRLYAVAHESEHKAMAQLALLELTGALRDARGKVEARPGEDATRQFTPEDLGGMTPLLAIVDRNRARLLDRAGRAEEAEVLWKRSLQWIPDSDEVNGHTLLARARVLLEIGQPDKAREWVEKALALLPAEGAAAAEANVLLARLLEPAPGLKALEAAIAQLRGELPADGWALAVLECERADLLRAASRDAEARLAVADAPRRVRETLGPDDRRVRRATAILDALERR